MRLHEIGQFYGERKGWRMFDTHSLTVEIKDYLAAEADFLDEVMRDGYHTVVEIGCGYGRYLDWALSRSYSYIGMDIVPWMVDLGQFRTARAKKKYPDARCGIIRHPAEEVAKAVEQLALNHPGQKALLFFPFNCLGNVAQFDTVLDSLNAAGLDVMVSTFKTDALATKIRKDYYGNCGYEQLNSRIMKQGLLIISEEGFHAMAYHMDFIANAFAKRGFELNRQHRSMPVGSIYLFRHGKKQQAASSDATDANGCAMNRAALEVTLTVLEDDPISQANNGTKGSGALLSFREISVVCQPLSAEQLRGQAPLHLNPGTALHVALPVLPSAGTDSEGRMWLSDLVGEVIDCKPDNESGSFTITVQLRKSDKGLLESLTAADVASSLSPGPP